MIFFNQLNDKMEIGISYLDNDLNGFLYGGERLYHRAARLRMQYLRYLWFLSGKICFFHQCEIILIRY